LWPIVPPFAPNCPPLLLVGPFTPIVAHMFLPVVPSTPCRCKLMKKSDHEGSDAHRFAPTRPSRQICPPHPPFDPPISSMCTPMSKKPQVHHAVLFLQSQGHLGHIGHPMGQLADQWGHSFSVLNSTSFLSSPQSAVKHSFIMGRRRPNTNPPPRATSSWVAVAAHQSQSNVA
jgi:hypothetical protein